MAGEHAAIEDITIVNYVAGISLTQSTYLTLQSTYLFGASMKRNILWWRSGNPERAIGSWKSSKFREHSSRFMKAEWYACYVLRFRGLTLPKFLHQGKTFIVCPLVS